MVLPVSIRAEPGTQQNDTRTYWCEPGNSDPRLRDVDPGVHGNPEEREKTEKRKKKGEMERARRERNWVVKAVVISSVPPDRLWNMWCSATVPASPYRNKKNLSPMLIYNRIWVLPLSLDYILA